MSKNLKIIILLVVAAVLALALVWGIVLKNAVFSPFVTRYIDPNAQGTQQTHFEADLQGINNIRLDFASEQINVVVTNENQIRIEETASAQLNQDEFMKCGVNGDTFFARSGLENNWSDFANWFNYSNIQVTLYVPAAYQNNFELNSVSGEIDAQDLKVNELELKTTSGRISAGNSQAKTIDINSTSGEVSLRNVQSGSIKIGEVSGTTSLNGGSFETVEAHSISGEIMLDGQRMNQLKLGSTSGSVNVSADQMPGKIEVNTVSGSVTLKLPENDGFTLKFHSVSGDASNDFAMAHDVYKNGGSNVDVGTTSGSLNIIKK